ncbi:MAG: hypothetical protein AD742_13765 [Methylibium sp. NZG]|nr:MAG: hypothetical protein AD742_13765 [Methylibium sp. NZG]
MHAQGNGDALLSELLSRYAEPHRSYHKLQHLGECLDGFDTVAHFAERPAEVEAALWFHDAIYELASHRNEEDSAMWAQQALTSAGVAAEAVARVASLVLATKHTALPERPDERLLVDIDLSILGAHPARFAEYEAQIRIEYAFVPEAVFRSKRRAILQAFLDRPHIFSTLHFRAALEPTARVNLARAVAQNSGTKCSLTADRTLPRPAP